MKFTHTFDRNVFAVLLLLCVSSGVSGISQDRPPFDTTPPVEAVLPEDSPAPAPLPPTPVDAEKDLLDPPFKNSENIPEDGKLQADEVPFKNVPPAATNAPRLNPSQEPNRSARPLPASPMTLEMEIVEVKRLAQLELDRIKVRGQYTTTLASSQLSKMRQDELALLREAVACSKNLVLGKRISLKAFLEIQRQCINAELALANTSSMRNAILRKAIDACTLVETKIKATMAVAGGQTTATLDPAELELVVLQRQHWEQLLRDGGSISSVSTSRSIESVVVGSYVAPTVYRYRMRRRR
jgi:hypothetical protein